MHRWRVQVLPAASGVSILRQFADNVSCVPYRRANISQCMGMLNIFRLHESPLEYQVTYNDGPNSWVRVFDPPGIEEFLVSGVAIDPGDADRMRRQLHDGGHAAAEIHDVSESHLVEEHFAKMPSDD